MMSLRSKFRANRARISSQWRCCFCCHVHTATIFFGMWNLLLQIMLLSVFAVLMRSPRLRFETEFVPTPQSKIEGSELSEQEFRFMSGKDMNSGNDGRMLDPRMLPSLNADRQDLTMAAVNENLNKAAIVVLFFLAVTLLMVYGAVKGKPSYLKPFFYLQVLDFCICSVKAVDYLCFLPDVHESLIANPDFPFHDFILHMDPQMLAFMVLLGFLIAMVIKGYFIGVVWSCYKYLKLRQVRAQCHIHYIDRMTSQSLLNDPPDYETAVKKFPAPPPSYEVATAMALDGAVQLEGGLAVPGPSGLQAPAILSVAAGASGSGAETPSPGLVVALPIAVPSTSGPSGAGPSGAGPSGAGPSGAGHSSHPHSHSSSPAHQGTPPPPPTPPFPSAVPTALVAVTGPNVHQNNDASAV